MIISIISKPIIYHARTVGLCWSMDDWMVGVDEMRDPKTQCSIIGSLISPSILLNVLKILNIFCFKALCSLVVLTL